MKLLDCKIHFIDGTKIDCNSIEHMLKVVFKEKRNKNIPISIEISGIDESGVIYHTRLNFVEFVSEKKPINTRILSQLMQQKLLGEILIEEKIITEQQLKEAIQIQNKYKEKLGEILVKFGYCKPEQILYALGKQLGIEVESIRKTDKGSVG